VKEEDQVVKITKLHPYLPRSLKNNRFFIGNIKAKSKHGKECFIEIKVTDISDCDKEELYFSGLICVEKTKEVAVVGEISWYIGIYFFKFHI